MSNRKPHPHWAKYDYAPFTAVRKAVKLLIAVWASLGYAAAVESTTRSWGICQIPGSPTRSQSVGAHTICAEAEGARDAAGSYHILDSDSRAPDSVIPCQSSLSHKERVLLKQAEVELVID